MIVATIQGGLIGLLVKRLAAARDRIAPPLPPLFLLVPSMWRVPCCTRRAFLAIDRVSSTPRDCAVSQVAPKTIARISARHLAGSLSRFVCPLLTGFLYYAAALKRVLRAAILMRAALFVTMRMKTSEGSAAGTTARE